MIRIRHIPHVVEVPPDEDIARLIEEVISSRSKEVYLSLPEGAKIFKNDLNLKLLKREAEIAQKEIVVVSTDLATQEASSRAGFRVRLDLPEEFRPQESSRAAPLAVSNEGEKPLLGSPFSRSSFSPKVYDILPPLLHEETRDETRTQEPSTPSVSEGVAEFNETKEVKEEATVEDQDRAERPPKALPRFSLPSVRFSLPTRFPSVGGRRTLTLAGITGAVVIVGFFVFTVIPRATIEIIPNKEKVTFEIDLVVSKGVSKLNFDEGTIPAEGVSVEVNHEQEFLSSGKETREEKAQGTITIYNQYSSSPQTLVETTRFISQEGKVFRTAKTVVVPGAVIEEGKILPSSIDADVVAVEGGTEYNIGPSTFSIPGFKGTPKYTAFYAKSSSSMSGGFIGEVKVVTEEDVKRAREALRTELTKKVSQEFDEKKPEGFVFLDGAKREDEGETTFTKNAGDAADAFTIKGTKKVSALLFREGDVREFVAKVVASRLKDISLFTKGSETLRYEVMNADFEKGIVRLRVAVEEELIPVIDAERIKRDLKGKSEVEVRKYFAEDRPDIERAKVTFFPRFFVRRVPSSERNIEVEIKME